MKLGVCSCNAGQDGCLCPHQAAIVRHFQIPSINCIPKLSPETRQHLAMIAIGPQAVQDSNLYSSSSKEALCSLNSTQCSDSGTPDFAGTAWDLMRSSAMDTQTEMSFVLVQDNLLPLTLMIL